MPKRPTRTPRTRKDKKNGRRQNAPETKIRPTIRTNGGSSRPSRSAARRRQRRHRIPQRQMGGGLFQAHRRDDRRAQEQGRAGVLGRPAVDPRHQVHRRRGLSQRSLSRARRARRRRSTSTCGTASSTKPASYSNFGPDFEGQMRRLRSSDGVYFTKSGARKLAHYVEREIRRYMSNRGAGGAADGSDRPGAAIAKSAVRPVAGPVVPLTVTPGNSEELLGGGGSAAGARRRHRQPRAGQGRAGAGARRDAPTISSGRRAATASARRCRRAARPRRHACGGGRGAGARRDCPQRADRGGKPPEEPKRGAGAKTCRPRRPSRNRSSAVESKPRAAASRLRRGRRPTSRNPARAAGSASRSARQRRRSHQEFVDRVRGLAALRGSPRPPAIGRGACRRRRTPSAPRSRRRRCRP